MKKLVCLIACTVYPDDMHPVSFVEGQNGSFTEEYAALLVRKGLFGEIEENPAGTAPAANVKPSSKGIK